MSASRVNNYPFPLHFQNMMKTIHGRPDNLYECMGIYSGLRGLATTLEVELIQAKAELVRLEAENNFMLKLIEKHIKE